MMGFVWFLLGIWVGVNIECNLHLRARLKELGDTVYAKDDDKDKEDKKE